MQSYDRYIRKSYASQDGWSERETKVLRLIIHPVISSSDWKIQINKVTFFKLETVFGDSLYFQDLLHDIFFSTQKFWKAQLATEAITFRRFAKDQFANGLGGSANVSGHLADVSKIISVTS